MHFKYISPAATLLLFSTLARAGDCEYADGDPVIAALSLLGPAATIFCSAFLGTPEITVTAATVTPIVTVTATSTVSSTIRVDKRAAATLAARACSGFGIPCSKAKRLVKPPVPGPLVPFAEALVSSACSLLGITPATTTITAKLPPTTTTTTIVTTATTTVKRGNCDADSAYSASGNGAGNEFIVIQATSSLDCCQKCQAMVNCIANGYFGNQCQILQKVQAAAGAQPTEQCPLGMDHYNFGPHVAGGMVFKGPCGF